MSAGLRRAFLAAILSFGTAARATTQEDFAELVKRGPALSKGGTQENPKELAEEQIREKNGYSRQDRDVKSAKDPQRRDYAEAAEALQGGIARAPGSAELWMRWADFDLERFRVLELELRGAQSGMAVVLRLEGQGLRNGKETREESLRQSATADPEQRGIWGELGVEQLKQGMREEAAAVLKTAQERQPKDLWTLRLEARMAAAQGDWREAEARLLELGRRSPAILRQEMKAWPRNLLPKASVPGEIWECVRKGSATCVDRIRFPGSEAQEDAEQLFAEERWEALAELPQPSSGDAPTQGADGLGSSRLQGQNEDAGKMPAVRNGTLKRAPTDSDLGYEQASAWYRRGVALAQLNDCARAIPALERGLGPGAETAAYWLELCYVAEAERAVNRLGALGNQAVFRRVRGDFLVRIKADVQGAIEEYAKARQLQPRDPVLAERLAQAYMSLGDMQRAQQAAWEALALEPRRTVAVRLLATIAMNERDYASALTNLDELLRKNPNDAWVRIQTGIAYAQTARPQEALGYLQPVLAAGYPDERGALHAMLASVLRKLGREQEAQSAAAEASRLSDLFQQHAPKSVDDHQ
jgi:predicted Zn-dependent protease